VKEVVEIDLEDTKPARYGYIHQYRMWYWLRYLVAKEAQKPECSHGECDLFCIEKPGKSVFRKQELSINFKKPEMLPDTVELLRECKKRFTFLITTFILPKEIKNGSGVVGKLKDDEKHANMVVIDNLLKTYERFEPYGYEERDGDLGHSYLKVQIEKYLGKLLPGYKLVPFEKSNLLLGPQELQFSRDKNLAITGTCVPLSCMLMHLKVLNPEVSTVELQKHMANRSGAEIHTMALRYVSLMYRYTPEIKRVKKLEKLLREEIPSVAIFEIAMFEAEIPNKRDYVGD